MAKKFRTKLEVEEIVFETKEGDRTALIKELPGSDIEEYLDRQNKNLDLKMDEAGKVTGVAIKNYKGVMSHLLEMCVEWKDKDIKVGREFIDSLPFDTQKELFDIASEINRVAAKKEEKEGNDQS